MTAHVAKLAATAACCVACALLVVAERRELDAVRVLAKIAASFAFVALGLFALPFDTFGIWMLLGLVLGALGDLFLLDRDARSFAFGLVMFLLGHLAYVVGIAQRVAIASWLPRAGVLAALPVVAGVIALALLWRRLGSMRVPVIAYVATIVAMVIGALAVGAWLALGAALFFASDLAVARDRFVAATFANKAWGLPTYYAAQCVIAWSLGSA